MCDNTYNEGFSSLMPLSLCNRRTRPLGRPTPTTTNSRGSPSSTSTLYLCPFSVKR